MPVKDGLSESEGNMILSKICRCLLCASSLDETLKTFPDYRTGEANSGCSSALGILFQHFDVSDCLQAR